MITFLWFKVSNKAAFSCLSSLVLVFPIIKFTGLLYSIVCSRRPAPLTAPYFSRPGPSAPLTPPSRWPPGPAPPPTTPYLSRPGPPALPTTPPVARPAGQKIENGKAWLALTYPWGLLEGEVDERVWLEAGDQETVESNGGGHGEAGT